MHDETNPRPARTPAARLWDLLTQQRTGVVCALASAALLGLGSFVIDAQPDRYRGLAMDDLRFFVQPPRVVHAWLYALAVSLAVWAASTLACTWDSVVSRLRSRVIRPSAYGAPVLHLAFVLALVAHLWGGLGTRAGQHRVTAEGAVIDGVRYRPLSTRTGTHPGGMPRTVTVTLERRVAGRREPVSIGYNHPLTSHGGAHELLLGEVGSQPDGVVMRHRGREAVLRPGVPATVAGDTLRLRRLHDPRWSASIRVPVAVVEVAGETRMFPLDAEGEGDTAFVAVHEVPEVLLLERRNPSVPLVLGVAGMLALGVVLVAWERVRRRGPPAPA